MAEQRRSTPPDVRNLPHSDTSVRTLNTLLTTSLKDRNRQIVQQHQEALGGLAENIALLKAGVLEGYESNLTLSNPTWYTDTLFVIGSVLLTTTPQDRSLIPIQVAAQTEIVTALIDRTTPETLARIISVTSLTPGLTEYVEQFRRQQGVRSQTLRRSIATPAQQVEAALIYLQATALSEEHARALEKRTRAGETIEIPSITRSIIIRTPTLATEVVNASGRGSSLSNATSEIREVIITTEQSEVVKAQETREQLLQNLSNGLRSATSIIDIGQSTSSDNLWDAFTFHFEGITSGGLIAEVGSITTIYRGNIFLGRIISDPTSSIQLIEEYDHVNHRWSSVLASNTPETRLSDRERSVISDLEGTVDRLTLAMDASTLPIQPM